MAAGGFFALDRASGAGYSVSRTEGTHQMRQRIPVTPVPERPPDVEAFFSFNDVRKSPARDGYRPAHRLTDTCLTTGVHYYYDVDSVPPNASARGTITFLSPEAYPHCLWVGKRIPMQEGAHVVGSRASTTRSCRRKSRKRERQSWLPPTAAMTESRGDDMHGKQSSKNKLKKRLLKRRQAMTRRWDKQSTRRPPKADGAHVCRPRSIFPAAHVAWENDWTFFRRSGGETLRGF